MTVTLVLGGARSGKSALAERLAGAGPGPVTYLATAVVELGDLDMAERVAAHRSRRPEAWRTVEVVDLVAALTTATATVLIDSLTTWVDRAPAFDTDVDGLCRALVAAREGDVVIVSDEVGLGVHPSSAAGRRFRDALGLVNQAVAEVADEVLLVVAGRALHLDRV